MHAAMRTYSCQCVAEVEIISARACGALEKVQNHHWFWDHCHLVVAYSSRPLGELATCVHGAAD